MANVSGRRIVTDLLGYGCLIAAPLIGWLPGPGGIPLLITGLGLLSIHNPWAKRLLHFVRRHSHSAREILFPDVRWIQRLWDLVATCILALATAIGWRAAQPLWRGLAISLSFIAITILAFNRHRLHRLETYANRIRRR